MTLILQKDIMDFPKDVTNQERTINWQKIAEISDQDFGFHHPRKKTGLVGFAVRIILLNDKGEICVIKSEKHDFMQMPGGGIEKDEGIIDALRRETREETGWLIKNIKPLGYISEKREDVQSNHSWDECISYVFEASPDEQAGTDYMEDEIAEGFKPIWIKIDDFVIEQERREGKIDSYNGCFSNRRDILVTKFFQNKTEPLDDSNLCYN